MNVNIFYFRMMRKNHNKCNIFQSINEFKTFSLKFKDYSPLYKRYFQKPKNTTETAGSQFGTFIEENISDSGWKFWVTFEYETYRYGSQEAHGAISDSLMVCSVFPYRIIGYIRVLGKGGRGLFERGESIFVGNIYKFHDFWQKKQIIGEKRIWLK